MGISAVILDALTKNAPWLTEWDFSKREINDFDITKLCSALQNNTHLKKVNFANNQITSVGASLLAQTALSEIDFSSNPIENIGVQCIAKGSKLQSLTISDIGEGLNTESAEALAQNTSLLELNISKGDVISKEIAVALAKSKTLKKFSLNDSISMAYDDIAKAFAKNSSITHLALNNCLLSDKSCQYLSKNRTITHLDISNNNDITDKGMLEIGRQMKQLVSLNASQASISDDSIIDIATHLKVLKELKLARTKISNLGVHALAHHKGIIKLDLSSNSLQDKDVIFFEDNKTLTHLNLSNNKISTLAFAKIPSLIELNVDFNKIEHKGCCEIANHRTLRSLSIDHNPLTLEAVYEFAKNKSMRVLDISRSVNGKSPIGNSIAIIMTRNSYLEELYMRNQNLSNEGFHALAQTTTLRKLDISSNDLTIQGAKSFAENTALRILDVSSCAMDHDTLEILIQNQALCELYANYNHINFYSKNIIVHAKNNIKKYHFVANNFDFNTQIALTLIPGLKEMELTPFSLHDFVDKPEKLIQLREQLDAIAIYKLETEYQQKSRFTLSNSKSTLFGQFKIESNNSIPNNSICELFN